MKNIGRKCNPNVNLSKFISDKKILSKVVPEDTINFVAKLLWVSSKSVQHFYEDSQNKLI